MSCSVAQSGESDELYILREQEKTSFFHIVKFIWPDWHLILAGVVFYSVIGASYPIIGALVAHVNNVSPISTCCIVHIPIVHFFIQIFSESDKDTILQLSQQVSVGLIALAFASGFFYFLGVKTP